MKSGYEKWIQKVNIKSRYEKWIRKMGAKSRYERKSFKNEVPYLILQLSTFLIDSGIDEQFNYF